VSAWVLRDRDLKRYPHFDGWITKNDAISLAADPARVATHRFYPFIRFTKRWRRFAKKGKLREEKKRELRYAARADAYIFARYRQLLSELYETELHKLKLDRTVLAYRRIRNEQDRGGKCNIHFARDAILKIQELKNCCVIALDISKFFEHLDHAQLKRLWCRLLNVDRLPKDHFQVFKAITQYAIVDKKDAYERLGYFGEKAKSQWGTPIKGYLRSYDAMPTHLCTGKQFRNKIAGGNGTRSIIEKNFKSYGVPQGAPISDLLANIYLLDFDLIIAKRATAAGGYYYRYSDDILIIVPTSGVEAVNLMKEASQLIGQFGSKLEIKQSKCVVWDFQSSMHGQTFKRLYGTSGRNGLEYLGFRYNGKYVYLRDSTLSGLYRRIQRVTRFEARALVRRYRDKDFSELQELFDYESVIERFGRVRNFATKCEGYGHWTFWTYARRATEIFGPIGKRIEYQLKRYRRNIRRRSDEELARALR
jgi:hypothetical protein